MRIKWKLFTAYGLLHASGSFLSFWLGKLRYQKLENGQSTDLFTVLFLIGTLISLTICYLIALALTHRLERLVILAEETAFSPALQSVHIPGNDEISSIAKSIESLRVELTTGEEVRTRLVADVAHELRTPLAIIRGQLETLQEKAEDVAPGRLLPLIDEVIRMSRLIKDLEQLSSAEAGQLHLSRKWVNFDMLVEEVTDILKIPAEAKNVKLSLKGKACCEVYCDPSRIRQVLINVIGNAIQYTVSGDTVTIHIQQQEEFVQIQVIDSGPGIPPEKLPYLFHRFYRADDSRNRNTGGTGLGLAIAKEFIEAHEGSISVTSEPGAGSIFTITLPKFPSS